MMRRKSIQFAASAFAGVVALSAAGPAWAQQASTAAGNSSRPRSTDERVNTELATPPPVNSDYRRAAEGTLPTIPGGTGAAGSGAIDPAARPLSGVNALPTTGSAAGRGAGMPAGMDVVLLIEHAVGMGIDSSMLAALAEANQPDAEGNDAAKALLAHAQDEMKTSKDLLTKAAAAGSKVDANSPIRKFYGAANGYMSTLGTLCTPGTLTSPNDKAQVVAINHAVKGLMDATHIQQFAGSAPGALGALGQHAQVMKDEGTKTLDSMAGTTPVDPAAPPTPALLAQRGRDLVDSINGLGTLGPIGRTAYGNVNSNGNGAMNGMINGQGPNPGRLQDTRPEIIGGTYGTGSPTAGTATGAEAARDVKNSKEGPNGELIVPPADGAPGSGTSGYGVGNNNTPPTQSTAGSRPR